MPQHLVDEIAGNVAVIAGEAGDEALAIGGTTQRQGGELQPGDPPFGARVQGMAPLGRDPLRCRLLEKPRRLLGREAQVVDADFDELSTRAQPRERQAGFRAAADHEVEIGRLVLDHEGHCVEYLLRLHDFEIVEHEDERVALRRHVVHQRGEDYGPAQRRARELLERCRAQLRAAAAHGAHHVGEESPELVVALLEREPGDGERRAGDPRGDGGCLAEAGWRRDDGDAPPRRLGQPRDDARSRQHLRPDGRHQQLGGQQLLGEKVPDPPALGRHDISSSEGQL